jgi:RNA polymerase sigma factor (TIGR02999 family)
MDPSANELRGLLQAAEKGDPKAAAQLVPLLYDELRRLARARLAKLPPGHTLQPTALVHEVYLRLLGRSDLPLEGRKQFFFAAARAMRDILVEEARRRAGRKRGGGRKRVGLTEDVAVIQPPSTNVLALHEALAELEKKYPLQARIVELRYFGGLTTAETAEVLGVSARSLFRHWRFAKAWLKSRLEEPD